MDERLRYIERLLQPPHPLLPEIDAEYEANDRVPPHIGIHAGVFLSWLLRLMGARRALELGTALGYSTVCLGEALRANGGALLAVELDSGRLEATRRHIARAGLADTVELLHGDAAEIVPDLPGPFDLILQDSAKPLYPQLLEDCIGKLRVGGVLAADDALFEPMGVRAELAAPIDEYNRRVFADARLRSTILPIGDGLALSLKIEGA